MKSRVKQKLLGVLVGFILVIITTVSASAVINPQINFQGKITNPDGTNITNGSYSIRFRMYSSPSLDAANTCTANSCLWEETKSITITDGIFQTALGDTTALPGLVDFNTNNIYLGIKVAADLEMSPRVRFTASPYAFNSEKVGGFTAAQLVQLSPGAQQTGSINVSGPITSASTLAIQGANAVTLGSTTNVGAILFQDGSVNNRTVTLNVAALLTASYSLTLPTSAPAISQCLQSGPTTASQLVFGACSTTPTLQQVYTASAAPALITLADAKDLQIGLSDTVTDSNFLVNVATGSTGRFAVQTNGTDVLSAQGGAIGTVNLGSVGATTLSSNVNIGNTSNATGTQIIQIGSSANAANSVSIGAGNTGQILIGNSTAANTIKLGSGGAAAGTIQSVTIGSNSTTSGSVVTLQAGNVSATTNNLGGVIISSGFSTTDTNLVPLILDSTSTRLETAGTCSVTANNGALYYNSDAGSNAVRACIAGGWEDLISTSGAFFTFFGVVPDSGTAPGDIQAIQTPNTTGPCKVSWASGVSVNVSACIAYSGGRKVTVPATTISLTALANGNFFHICLSSGGTNPLLTTQATGGTEIAGLGSVSFPSASTPIVCLADVKTSATAINGIYDTRVFTTSTKEFAYSNAAVPLGVLVQQTQATSLNRVSVPAAAAAGYLRGVVVATSGAATAGAPNVIIVTSGNAFVKTTVAVPQAITTTIQSTGAAGYATAAAPVATIYANAGISQNSTTFLCSTVANCNGSILTVLNIR